MNDMTFNTFEDFINRWPLNEVTIPVAIQPPDEEGDYWLIQLALPMKNKVLNCSILESNTREILKYKKNALSYYKHAMQFGPNQRSLG